jgi:phage gp29-like protein
MTLFRNIRSAVVTAMWPMMNRIATAPGSAIDMERLVRGTNRWREWYNPLRGLTVARSVTLLEAGQRGEFADLQWLFRLVEKRNATHRALIIRRRAALQKLDWDIKIVAELPPGSTEAQAEAQKQTLREAYDGVDNLRAAIAFLALAEFRGFSHLQKHRSPDGDVLHLEPLDQWTWLRDGLYGPWAYNKDSRATTFDSMKDKVIDPAGFIIRECDMAIDEIGLLCYLRKNLSQKDWDAFIEIYGIPSGVVVMPGNIQQGKEADYEEAAARIASGGSGALPAGSDYKPNDQPRGVNPFRDHIRYQDEELVLAGTSGKLTMLTESGSGTLAGGAHEDTFDEIAEGEAAELNEIFQTQFDADVLAREHEGEPALAYFELCKRDEADIAEEVENTLKLGQAGYQRDVAELSEKTGYTLELRPQLPMGGTGDPPVVGGDSPPTSGLRNRAQRGLGQAAAGHRPALRKVIRARATSLQPVFQRLEALLQTTDQDTFQRELEQLLKDVPDLADQVRARPEYAQALQEVLAESMTGAVVDELRKKTTLI